MNPQLLPTSLTALALITSIFLWCIFTFLKSRKAKAPLPPGPRGLPIVGYLPYLGVDLHVQYAELARKYGPIFRIWLGNKLCVVISLPSLIKEVVRDQDTVFAHRDPPVAAWIISYGGLDIAWSSYGSYWRDMRKLFVREMLSNSNLDACYNLRKDEVRRAIRDVHGKTGTGAPVNVGDLIFLTELNVVMSMLWGSGTSSDKLGSEFKEVISKITVAMSRPNLSDFFPAIARFDLQGVEREMKKLLGWVDRILDEIIDERVKMVSGNAGGSRVQEEGRKDFLQIILELKEKKDIGTSLNMQQIKALLMDIVAGGTDTTATTAEWAMAEIMNSPEVMKKVQEELTDVIGLNNNVEEHHLPKLKYLDAVVKEVLRLHPALPLLVPKCPSEPAQVGGYTIPKGTRVFLNVWAVHRDPMLWENPEEFNPERFLDNGKWDYIGKNFQYIPFGSGRRICAGLPLAEKMLMYLLASLMHSFEWKLPMDEKLDLTERFGIVIKKSKPLLLLPSQRLPDLHMYH